MIKYHILSLIALAVLALSGIEAAALFYETTLRGELWYGSGKGWLMVLVSALAVYLYFRARKLRKSAVGSRVESEKK